MSGVPSSTSTSLSASSPTAIGPTSSTSTAALYLYTFIATLIILLAVASAIVVRSVILRRRHQRLLDHPTRQGANTAAGGRTRRSRNDIGPPVRKGAVGEKPGVWETWIQRSEVVDGHSGRLAWTDIKPISMAYIDSGKEEPPPQHVEGPLPAWGILGPFRRRSRSVVSPTSPPIIKSPPTFRSRPSKLRAAVLVAMPTPDSSSVGSLCKVGGLPPIEMGTVEIAIRDD
ncbi:hypothetical protein F5J12DRAFT_404230 [Pisolithus orientalis]|uniref:uncharacterized protein n=1 Tax=Pisolithus orientalis TaxID=936130 RepID=UPI0022254454|nr:uncharacterized protein F5J12DRAFT_404230 [Pisolithus orientalis]KAI5995302.1 hypothetical protein F5J12DRAFT_404230 [Pisolithus orientalis]